MRQRIVLLGFVSVDFRSHSMSHLVQQGSYDLLNAMVGAWIRGGADLCSRCHPKLTKNFVSLVKLHQLSSDKSYPILDSKILPHPSDKHF